MDLAALHATAMRMLEPGKGFLAADESTGTIEKRFDAIGVENTEEHRRDYREFLFRDAEAMRYISAVILYTETLYQDAADGTPLVKLIEAAGAVPGIKIDEGAKPMAGFPGETLTEGLDGLPDRLAKAYRHGARFSKWRAAIPIDVAKDLPSWGAIRANAMMLARYAATCQEQGLTPIVEPEVLMDGDHDIETCERVTRWTLETVFDALYEQRVALEGMILKPNMVVSGLDCRVQASVDEVAHRSVALYKACVPAAVPGIAFLSGGMSDEEATARLNAMNRIGGLPWRLTFSYGRALQHAAQAAWAGKPENVPAAQRAFAHRARMNSLAALGQWEGALERAA
ncbi:MAG TPA: class I fructose-bisphosphate aldolase [Caulobacteraceae bacterium]|jgi:fructose-bisphosphate aldolase class I|nr:class I fructose-bisphosphate aldolase [Caulobacteraceae bacterium]